MLEVRFRRDSRQRLSSILAAGHAEAGVAGDDVVCAAASAILQAAELGLTSYARIPAVATRSEGRMEFAIPEATRARDDVKAIAATAELAIAQLAWQFPHNVRIVREAETEGANDASTQPACADASSERSSSANSASATAPDASA